MDSYHRINCRRSGKAFAAWKEAFPEGALGWLLTALLGIVGAFIGSFIARTLWAGENYAVGWIMSILGAVILLLLVRLVMGRRTTV